MDDKVFRNLHVLVVDDETFMRELVRRMLRELDIGIVSGAKDGADAMGLLKSPGSTPVDIILLDLEMPVLNGYNFILEMKKPKNAHLAHIPIIVLSGHTEEEAVRAVQALGIRWYLAKPVSKSHLENRVRSVMKAKNDAK